MAETQVSHRTIELPAASLALAGLVPHDAWQLFDNYGPLDTRTGDEPVCVRIQFSPEVPPAQLASLLQGLSSLLSETAVR